jgi:hypothetical protein
MYKLSQKDLLSEGVWSNLGKGAMAATKGIAKTLDYVAPELTNPIHGLEKGLRDIGSSIKQGWQGEQGTIKKNLEDQGYKVGEMTKVGKNWKVKVQEMTIDPATGNEIPTGPEIFKIVTPEKTIRTQPQAGSGTSPPGLYQYGGKYYAPDLSKAPVPRGNSWEITVYNVDANNRRLSSTPNIITIDRNHVVSNVR